jgi:zinc transport system permease protein
MLENAGFLQSWFVWRDAMVVALISAAALSYLGVWVALKKAVYVPLALSQVSSVGVMLAYLLSGWFGISLESRHGLGSLLDPAWVSLVFALVAALWFARVREDATEQVVVAYLLSAAMVLILGGLVRQDLHDVQTVLFGSAVLVETVQIAYVTAAALVTVLVQLVMHRRFLFVSFDPDAAGAAALRPFWVEVLLYASFALMISVATRAIGALPAFGLMVLPGLTGLRVGRSMRAAFSLAVLAGVVAAGFGYYASFVLGLPTGASMVTLAGAFYLGSLAVRR